MHSYVIDDVIIENVNDVIDLGVHIDRGINFNLHIDNIVCKSLKILGFVIRQTKEFSSIRALVILFKSLVRSTLEYCNIIWSPHYNNSIVRLENVQKKFIKSLCFKFNIEFSRDNYVNILNYFGCPPLEHRRRYFDLCFIFKLLNNQIDCSIMLSLLPLKAGTLSTRNTVFFSIPFHRTTYGMSSPLTRIIRTACLYDLDFCGVSLSEFKCQVRTQLML